MKGIDRREIEDRLAFLAKRDGRLRVDAVIEEAKNPQSPLHDQFEWDDGVAAEAWRRAQARRLIRSVRVRITVESHRVVAPAYLRDPSAPSKEQGFAETVKIRTEKETAMAALMYEIERAEAAVKRARTVAEVLGLGNEVEALIREIAGLKRQARKAA